MITQLAACLAVALSLAGNVGVVHRRRWGMATWIVANVIWVTYHVSRRDWPSVLLFGAYLGLAIWGFCDLPPIYVPVVMRVFLKQGSPRAPLLRRCRRRSHSPARPATMAAEQRERACCSRA